MLKRVEITNPDEYFIDLGKRREKGVYFCRINAYNRQIHDFIQRYYESARLKGVIIEGKLQNPDNQNLAYYTETMGTDFQLSMGFIGAALKKWLPRMTDAQRQNVAAAIYDTLAELKKSGKNENMLKNAYIKFMCWLYYKFERIVHQLGEEKLPKILYEGSISNYELLLMNVLSIAGCDILLLQYQGDAEYLKLDPASARSEELKLAGMSPFPPSFSLKQLRQEMQEEADKDRLYGRRPKLKSCTNAWITGEILEDVRKSVGLRGSDQGFFYNCFCRIRGVEDKLTYPNELLRLQAEIRAEKRKLVIVNESIEAPTMTEIEQIQRKNYQNKDQMLLDLLRNLDFIREQELQAIVRKAFIDLLLEESQKAEMNLNRLTNKAVYLLCWLKRYSSLFTDWRMPEIACFFYMGVCRNENEALFCRFLARLPVDVLLFNPNLNQQCCLEDALLYEVHYEESLNLTKFPEEKGGIRVATAAYHAERELDTLLYQDSGIYRNQQYEKANTVLLQTMYEEIPILWEEELKYRPNFLVTEDHVNMPVIFAKVSGVKDGKLPEYWSDIKKLLTEDCRLIDRVPQITSVTANPIKAFATEFFRNGRLQRARIKEHRDYRYGFLRESMQDYILDKLQLLIEQKIIKGTFENGTEYTIVSVALNLEKDILRLLQKFDFTKKNPKLVYIITGEALMSLEDAIRAVFLNMLGFDVLFFVPTGYQCIEKFLNKNSMEEHQIGEYIYDLQVPDFDRITEKGSSRQSWRNKIFKRGT